ncbi:MULTISPECIES: NUDIX domain-containing protein [Streptomyces]|uniref:NUDIX domain-containing protein n=1 Tax=Streptomyces tsukubensis (strain DSM 42081 / NBRC 108919 / NRRL 18488 / 9993) TaxID=1114943 RepID=I2MWA1_STRT9|nr:MULTISPECIES: NUDIX domain-containing protein [Streptomyces]AZK93484.1 NUDIX hydrolase [Streptomyces tsukubensis]EIF89048.1 NUDIX hydrolase [Streptomyces tsukubensis NRRL18488]MYS66817.1 NUDIX domain-containing protein [Streptomyces sp. SID5473]QKM70366.1 NUDIX domain-containing protein [Streptomyces tsukubensis NRRL18488]TAI45650.1 NUDIX domain-containing protein [Streptomyces tsukubensis]
MGYVGSYVWKLRQSVGSRLLLMPGAQILLEDPDGRVLFQQRADNGQWEIPAGACEEGSDFAGTAVTELEEETGLLVRREDLVPFGSLSDPGLHTFTYPNGDVMHCFALLFAARTWAGEPSPDPGEVVRIAWHRPDDPPAPLHKPTAAVLEMYREFNATGRFQAR